MLKALKFQYYCYENSNSNFSFENFKTELKNQFKANTSVRFDGQENVESTRSPFNIFGVIGEEKNITLFKYIFKTTCGSNYSFEIRIIELDREKFDWEPVSITATEYYNQTIETIEKNICMDIYRQTKQLRII